MTLAPALLVAALLAADSPAPPPAPAQPASAQPVNAAKSPAAQGKHGKAAPSLPPASLPTVEGDVVEVDHRAHRLRLRTATGEVALEFDRNTIVRGPEGAATPLQLTTGARVRAGREGAARAAWVELRPATSTPKPTP